MARLVYVAVGFYGVYILQSEPSPRAFYIGSTPHPARRLRQHNGHLKQGAFRTARRGRQPWAMIAIVHSFPSRVAALQFEHALQHPGTSRHFGGVGDRATDHGAAKPGKRNTKAGPCVGYAASSLAAAPNTHFTDLSPALEASGNVAIGSCQRVEIGSVPQNASVARASVNLTAGTISPTGSSEKQPSKESALSATQSASGKGNPETQPQFATSRSRASQAARAVRSAPRSALLHLRNVAHLLQSPYFSRMGLEMTVFRLSLHPVLSVSSLVDDFAAFCARPAPTDYYCAAKKAALTTARCHYCKDAIDYVPDTTPPRHLQPAPADVAHRFPLLGVCPGCNLVCHLRCMAHAAAARDGPLIPAYIDCAQCGGRWPWRPIADMATRIRHYALAA